MTEDKRLVWDLPLRVFHWLFAVSIFASWATAQPGSEWMKVHMRLGYWMIGLLLFRIIWGLIGPRHARFASFLKGPHTVWRYAKGLAARANAAAESVGHNPLGALMVVVMLLLVAFQVTTGLFASDDIAWTGPYYPEVSDSTAQRLTGLHHANFNLILAAIGLHVIAIVYYTFVKRQALIPPMLSGYKPASHVPADAAIASSELVKAAIVIAIASAAVYALLSAAPPAVGPNTY